MQLRTYIILMFTSFKNIYTPVVQFGNDSNHNKLIGSRMTLKLFY